MPDAAAIVSLKRDPPLFVIRLSCEVFVERRSVLPEDWNEACWAGYLPELTVCRLLVSERPVDEREVPPAVLLVTNLAYCCMTELLLNGLLLLD